MNDTLSLGERRATDRRLAEATESVFDCAKTMPGSDATVREPAMGHARSPRLRPGPASSPDGYLLAKDNDMTSGSRPLRSSLDGAAG
jgi:hypothetical protein